MNIEYKQSVWSINEEQAIEDLKQLELDERCFYPESDYGHGYIYKTENGFECYSIPMYGGQEMLENVFDNAEDAFKEVRSWT